jgi:nucleoside-diphosphate-sugar epimerase
MRQRLDLIVNIFCNLAHNRRSISVYGGNQLRPNIHIKDAARFYELLLNAPFKVINKQAFNIGYKNYSVVEIAKKVVKIFGKDIVINKFPTNDKRSYHISSAKVFRILKFKCRYSINDAIVELKKSFENKLLRNTLKNPKFYNISVMKNYKFKKNIYSSKSLR